MRKVICAFNISIDGCYDHTKFVGDDEILNYFTNLFQDVDLDISGRKMYELMTPYWPDVAKTQSGTPAANAYANTVKKIQSIVVSRTMPQVGGGPRILRKNIEDEVRKLKEMPGKTITIAGMTLRAQLMAAGLIDELYIVVHPVLTGAGPRFMDDAMLENNITMKLLNTTVLKNGCIALHYAKL